ncbi:MAG: phosphoesterase, partial [Bacteroidetes bacterium]
KIEKLIGQFPEIFKAFRKAGKKIKITVLPGNHDYELACYPEFVAVFKAYNITLEQTPAITREIGGKYLWIEHGNQYDTTNRMPDFGNPHAMPIGYFITSNMVGKAGQISEQGRYNWVKDIQSVYPTELIPDWIMSNYFYREMSPVLRWILLPFLLLSGVTLFVLGGAALEYLNITDDNIFLNNRIFDSLGVVGSLLQIILTINAIALLVFLALAIPFAVVLRDLKKTLERFDIEMDPAKLTGSKNNSYMEAAGKIFENDADVIAFIYGHTHTSSIEQKGDRFVINTGTWLKRFERVSPRFGLLPAIYVPHYNLNYFKVKTEGGNIVIEYHKIDKSASSDLSLVERIMVSRKRRKKTVAIPSKTLVNFT